MQEEIDKKTASVLPHMLTILGIFTGIIFVFVTSFELAGNALNGIAADRAQISIAMLLVVGQVLFNLIFVFMFCIAQLTERPSG
ncbi:MAG: hypothetical protein FWE28_07360 [Oscillospiraceae bacterium]|nr:hypothetical protein [Oscillospiraceae bacterium]